MGENKKELEWKNHAPFFTNLNDDLKHLKSVSSNRDMKNQRLYYTSLEDFNTHYYIYIDSKEVDKKLEEIKKVLYSIKYAQKEWDKEYYNLVLDAMDKLRQVHRELIKGVYTSGLIPQFEWVDTSTPAAVRNKK